jgi:SAM-dependent methyltransferase
MNPETATRLNRLNRDFYRLTAQSFDETRQTAWPGWEALLPYLPPQLSVLDVGCGNGRFGLFLQEHRNVEYHGLDSSVALLDLAQQALPAGRFDLRDIVESPPDAGTYDLVALFGVLHHIPGADRRKALIHMLADRVASGGLLAFATWRFYEFERFQRRIVPWPADLRDAVEVNDYLLDWQRDLPAGTALRYCHYVDDLEQVALIVASGLTPVITYRSDGHGNAINCYSVLRRQNT